MYKELDTEKSHFYKDPRRVFDLIRSVTGLGKTYVGSELKRPRLPLL